MNGCVSNGCTLKKLNTLINRGSLDTFGHIVYSAVKIDLIFSVIAYLSSENFWFFKQNKQRDSYLPQNTV